MILFLVRYAMGHFHHTNEEVNIVSNIDIRFVTSNRFTKFLSELLSESGLDFIQLIHKRNLNVPKPLKMM